MDIMCLPTALGDGGPRRIPSHLTVILAEPGSILLPQPNIFLLQLNAPLRAMIALRLMCVCACANMVQLAL